MNEAVKDKIAGWLAEDDTGVSSETIALYLGFGKLPRLHSHPWDPDDFHRCLKLLERVPELRDELHRMAAVSPTWAALVERWGEVEESFLDEVGMGWWKARRAPRTYDLMQRIRTSAGR